MLGQTVLALLARLFGQRHDASQGSVSHASGSRFVAIERETLEYKRNGRALQVGMYGSWRRGNEIHFVINSFWQHSSGLQLADDELAVVVQEVKEYAAKAGVRPKISVDRSSQPRITEPATPPPNRDA
jgi:hypothetical protein